MSNRRTRDLDLRDGDDQHKPEPSLDIHHCLQGMIPAPLAASNTHLIRAEALNGNDLLPLVEILRLHGRVGHQEDKGDTKQDGQATAKDEDGLVLVNVWTFNVPETKGNQRSDYEGDAVHCVPV